MLEAFLVSKSALKGRDFVDMKLVPAVPGKGLDEKSACLLGRMPDAALGAYVTALRDHWREAQAAGAVEKRADGSILLTAESRLGMRLALAFGCEKNHKAREMFADELAALPDEVVLYHFTGAFYGQRRKAFRKALTALLTTPDDPEKLPRKPRAKKMVTA